MAKLVWDQVGEKLWETGVDRTVLFPMNNNGTHAAGVAWSGITAINESPSGAEPTKIYADNIVYGVLMSPEEDALTVEAFTYPDEYASCIGEAQITPGAVIKQQNHAHFGLAYRTMIGNDTDGTSYGYKIHLFWDCVAGSSEDSNSTINDSPEQKTFSWSVTTLPVLFRLTELSSPQRNVGFSMVYQKWFSENALTTDRESLMAMYGTEVDCRMAKLNQLFFLPIVY